MRGGSFLLALKVVVSFVQATHDAVRHDSPLMIPEPVVPSEMKEEKKIMNPWEFIFDCVYTLAKIGISSTMLKYDREKILALILKGKVNLKNMPTVSDDIDTKKPVVKERTKCINS